MHEHGFEATRPRLAIWAASSIRDQCPPQSSLTQYSILLSRNPSQPIRHIVCLAFRAIIECLSIIHFIVTHCGWICKTSAGYVSHVAADVTPG